MKEVGKLTVLDFNSQEEWESHQREVGRLNILVIIHFTLKLFEILELAII